MVSLSLGLSPHQRPGFEKMQRFLVSPILSLRHAVLNALALVASKSSNADTLEELHSNTRSEMPKRETRDAAKDGGRPH